MELARHTLGVQTLLTYYLDDHANKQLTNTVKHKTRKTNIPINRRTHKLLTTTIIFTTTQVQEAIQQSKNISTLCMEQNTEHICIAGDMNTELTRQNSWHINGIKRFVTDESLYFPHEHPTSNFEYSYFNTTYNTFTIIYHFIVTKHLYDYIVKHDSLCDEVDNQSDHCPIVYSLNIDVCKTIHSPTVHISRKQWYRESESDKSIYRNELDFFVGRILLHTNSTQKKNHTHNCTLHNLPISNIVFELK